MSPTRREVLAQLAALVALPLPDWVRTGQDPLDGTIADYQAGRRRGAWTAAQVTAQALDRCRSDGARWRAIDALSDTALGDARAADARLRAGRVRGSLDGVPVFAKAFYDLKGLPTTGSNAEWARLFPDPLRRDALEVARLRAAGAIVLGKTAADDFAYRGNGTSSHTGQVLNPHDPTGTRTPGGSSAGSAVAVADGMAFAALGTDDGGSNRIPAQFTGVVGMKPTFGLVPRTGVIPTWPYLDTHGPLARTVADAALLLAAVAGADPSDPFARTGAWHAAPLAALRDDALAGVRLGLVEAHVPRVQMTPEALAVWERAVGDLRAAGAAVEAFAPAVTLATYKGAFAAAAGRRGDVVGDPKSPATTAHALYRYFAGRTGSPRAAVRQGYPAYRVLRCAPRYLRGVRAAARAAPRGGPGGTRVRPLERRGRGGARRVDAHGRRRGDGLPDHALQRAARRGRLAGHPHHPRLRQLARPAGGVGPGGPRHGRDARAQPVRGWAAG